MTGDPDFGLGVIESNLQRVDATWSATTYTGRGDTKTLQFNNENCLQILQRVCEEWNLFYQIASKTISLHTTVTDAGVQFEYGKGLGLYSLVRRAVDSKNIVTRLWGFGGERNLPSDYKNYTKRSFK